VKSKDRSANWLSIQNHFSEKYSMKGGKENTRTNFYLARNSHALKTKTFFFKSALSWMKKKSRIFFGKYFFSKNLDCLKIADFCFYEKFFEFFRICLLLNSHNHNILFWEV